MQQVTRRNLLKVTSAGALAGLPVGAAQAAAATPVKKWEIFEVTLHGPHDGNPFRDVALTAVFSQGGRRVETDGFYDGDGVYKIRFMPDSEGPWTYEVSSATHELDGQRGQFTCTPADAGVHGPVGVQNGQHFAYADGKPFRPFGTTSYAWIHQSEALQQTTLASLAKSPFNKIRMCVFPKHYEYNHNEPALYPFVRSAAGVSDFTRPDPAFYRHLEARIADLRALNIEADLILFHPYDRWGYAEMSADDDDHYVRYAVARLSAFRNVWWSLANEYDFMKSKTVSDFDRIFRLVARCDSASHLRSIHYGRAIYDYGHSWVTHASLQTAEFEKTAEYLKTWNKPVVFDEVQYEGNLNRRWGNLSGEEMTYRFWRGVVGGAYVTHGETMLGPHDAHDESGTPTLWWAHGGALRGASPARIAFLRKLLDDCMPEGVRNGMEGSVFPSYPNACAYRAGGKIATAILYFLDYHQPVWFEFPLPEGRFTAEIIDPWAMTRTPVQGTFSGKAKLELPARPYRAVLFRRAGD